MSKKTIETSALAEGITTACQYLKLSHLAEHWPQLLEQSVSKNASPEEHLHHCLRV